MSIYSTYLGGSGFDFGAGIGPDKNGNAYVTGGTDSTNFLTTPDALQPANAGSQDAFVAKIGDDDDNDDHDDEDDAGDDSDQDDDN